MTRRGIATRISLVALLASSVAIGILGVGVWVMGGQAFTSLMVQAGDSADHARAMFDQSVTGVLVVALVLAMVASVTLSVILARRLARPLEHIGDAAERVAAGDYRARVPAEGPTELASLGRSFNRMAESLEDQQRLRSDLVANAAHELRTPLTNLEGYLEALRDGVIQADRATYESLLEEAERLVRLARSLDDLAEGDRAARPAHPVDLDLGAVLSSAVELARPTFDVKGISVDRRWPSTLRARADPDHLAQVLANLLQNAIRYTPSGGWVTVSADAGGDPITVSIVNTGEGIPKDDLPRVFERFYRVEKSRDRARGGAGIGLAIVKQLVEAGGGRVGAESAAGRTRFWFSLPGSHQGGATG
ncbi:MAG: HAMP domain-containing histidine kinase [Chloroflexi bacterium]|nr:HAMP domain-containing histidine kinase [Chloroflexota bacterium]